MSCPDGPNPLELELTNDPDGFDPLAGNVLTLNVGNPSQQLKFTPATSFINSAVHIVPACGNSSDPACSGDNYGGIFDSTLSQTYSAASFNNWNGSRDAGQTTLTSTYFNDVFKLSNTDTLSAFPMVTLDNMLDIPNVFGIGVNSTAITQAYTAGLISSNSWSLYAGTTTVPGSLILGGYSTRFIEGELFGSSSDPACTICFEVASISFDSSEGNVPILRPGEGTFLAQFEPFANWLAFPSNIFDSWFDSTNATVGGQDFPVYRSSRVPDGNLTITLTSGISVTIPKNDLFTSTTINGNGSVFTPLSGNQIAKIRRAPATTGVLGFPFLSHVYMIYDNERRTLNVSKAVANAQSDGEITAICPLSTGPTPPNESGSSPAQESSGRNNTGAIAGGVVGGLVALLIAVVAIVFLILRHKRKQTSHRPVSDASDMPLEKDSENTFGMSYYTKPQQDQPAYRQVTTDPVEAHTHTKVEMPGDSPVHELPSSNMRGPADISYDTYELPADPVTGTMASWNSSTISSNNAAGNTHASSKVSPLWSNR